MSNNMQTKNNVFVDCYQSFRALPGWVQVWVFFILMPINMASLFFIQEAGGVTIAFLANVAMMLNMPVMVYDRGFSKLMAFPHLIPWTILIALIIFSRPEASGPYDVYLWALLGANTISLIFDYPDALQWFRGARGVAGKY